MQLLIGDCGKIYNGALPFEIYIAFLIIFFSLLSAFINTV